MRKLLLASTALTVLSAPAWAQNVTCPTRPAGDNTNACASTQFVQGTLSGGGATNQSANQVFSGPSSGVPAPPSFRALVGADLPAPGPAAFGGVQSLTCSASNWFRTLSTGGVFGCSQPAFSDLAGNIAVSQMASGTNASATTFWRGDGSWSPALPNSAANLYISTTGNDSNSCLVGSQCLTPQRAANVAIGYYIVNGVVPTINIGAGTFTSGAIISGIIPGAVNANGSAPMLKIVGAGSGSTTISIPGACGNAGNALYISDGAVVGIGSIKLTTACSGGNDISVNNGAKVFGVNADVNFGAASNALLYVYNASADWNYGGSFGLTISGGAAYGIAGSMNASIITGIGVTNTISGTPTFTTTFLSLIDNARYNEGITSSWANPANAGGVRYSIANNSHIDREQNSGNLPGSSIGTVQGGSVYYANPSVGHDLPCVGGASGCRNATAPTGMGTGGTISMVAGSNDHTGSALLAFGTAPGGSGDFVIAPISQVTGDWGGGGHCVVSLNNNASLWPTTSSPPQAWYDNAIHIHWVAAVSASANYYISYNCG